MRRRTVLAAAGTVLLGGGVSRGQTATAAVRASLAPGGTLRAAINYGNAALAVRDASGGLDGVSVGVGAWTG